MATLGEMLGNAKRTDLVRIANNKPIPIRGKKKHESQMTQIEKDYLFRKLLKGGKWGVHPHAFRKIAEKGIEVSYDDVVNEIHNSRIVEYHLAPLNGIMDKRVVIRGNSVVNRQKNMHIVFSLTRREIVSIWINSIDDRHRNLDMKDYNGNLLIVLDKSKK